MVVNEKKETKHRPSKHKHKGAAVHDEPHRPMHRRRLHLNRLKGVREGVFNEWQQAPVMVVRATAGEREREVDS